jgi:acylphosphatase
VVGYVRNLPDGRVEVLLEGESAEIDRFAEAIHCELGGFIRSAEIQGEPPGSPPLEGFTVRF